MRASAPAVSVSCRVPMTVETFWIWGRHPVLESLVSGAVRQVLIAEGRRPSDIVESIREVAKQHSVPVKEVSPERIRSIAPDQNTQGVAAEITIHLPASLRDLLRSLPPDPTGQFLLALDQVQDPHNLGALIRTADAVGVGGIILPRRHSVPLSGVVAKTSAGALSHVPVLYVTNLARAMDEVREFGIWIVGLENGNTSIFQSDLSIPLMLVVGSEGHGLRRLTREHVDLLVSVPMFGTVRSLNASVAGSVAMYEALRQRLEATPGTDPAS